MPELQATALVMLLAAGCMTGASPAGAAHGIKQPQVMGGDSRDRRDSLIVLAQNPSNPFSLPQVPEPPVSPLNPGTLPGTTSAATAGAGVNPITGRPCAGLGALSVSGAGGLPGSSTPPPGSIGPVNQVPVGTPPVSSIFGSSSSLGAC